MNKSTLAKHQKKVINRTANGMAMSCTIRHDDECSNGHNTFAITLDAYTAGKPRTDKNFIMGGCCHDEVKKYFPEVAHLIRWHLCSTDGPMHYLENTIYAAGDKDCYGKRKGEPIHPRLVLQFGEFPIRYRKNEEFIKWLQKLENFDLEIMTVEHAPDAYSFSPKYTFLPYGDGKWYRSPFDTEQEAREFLQALQSNPVTFHTEYQDIAKGKEPDLDAARESACWPDATLEQLTDKEALLTRLPALMAEFRADVEAFGLIW